MKTDLYYEKLNILPSVIAFCDDVLISLKDRFEEIDAVAEICQAKVLCAMQKNRVSADCFHFSGGYGYDDFGRDTLEKVYADAFGAESALVRPSITCGTHALAVTLQALLRPGDILLSPAGGPYDTLEEVIGIRSSRGSLAEFNIGYRQVDLLPGYRFDKDGTAEALKDSNVKVVTFQRSKGYQPRPSFSVSELSDMIGFVKSIRPDVICMVDNCYGEFAEITEPTESGADLIVGSLIKNPGGGLAPIGGYIAGRADLIEACSYRVNAPGLGREVGASLWTLKDLYQGFFMAPVVTASAMKTAVFAAACYEKLGFEVVPPSSSVRTDIIQSIILGDKEKLCSFCEGIQGAAPVDSFVTPEPWNMPGYEDPVIMAAGAFIQGSSIELSADGPIREPYAVYFQGGLTWFHGKTGIMKTLSVMEEKGLISLTHEQ